MQYTASRHVRPIAMIEDGACQPCALIASDIQNPSTVSEVQVRRSTGVTSASMLLHLSGSANVVVSLGMIHPLGVVFFLISLFADCSLCRTVVVIGETIVDAAMWRDHFEDQHT